LAYPVFISPYWFLIAACSSSSTRVAWRTVAAQLAYVVAAAFVVLLYASVLSTS
jgi:hypothetical protein